MTRKHLIALATATTVLAMVGATLAGTASAATKDYASPDGTCYSSGWCHWNEVCYDAFGGCYFNFWCPQGATLPGQCSYYGGFQPYVSTAASSASGPGTSVITTTATIDTSTNPGGVVTLTGSNYCVLTCGTTDTGGTRENVLVGNWETVLHGLAIWSPGGGL